MSKNQRVPLSTALAVSESLADQLSDLRMARGSEFEICGSIRRSRPSCGDIDLVIARRAFEKHHSRLMELLYDPHIAAKSGELKSGSFEGMKVEFYPVPDTGWGAMMLFATGSPKFNIFCRVKAKDRGLKLSQYGLHDSNDELVCDCTEELPILQTLGIPEFVEIRKREL